MTHSHSFFFSLARSYFSLFFPSFCFFLERFKLHTYIKGSLLFYSTLRYSILHRIFTLIIPIPRRAQKDLALTVFFLSRKPIYLLASLDRQAGRSGYLGKKKEKSITSNCCFFDYSGDTVVVVQYASTSYQHQIENQNPKSRFCFFCCARARLKLDKRVCLALPCLGPLTCD